MAMSLQPQEIAPVPEETERIARAAFPKGNIYLRLRDEIGTIFDDPMFAPLFPARGQPAECPWQLALITVMQFIGLMYQPPPEQDGIRSIVPYRRGFRISG